MKEVNTFSQYLINNLTDFEFSSAGGMSFNYPKFELNALDYLRFAEEELIESSTRSLVNCVGHLKRATDCQLDTFLNACNLYELVKKKSLGVDAKLNFLSDIGVFNSRSLKRLNSIRNKMEHYYEIPKIEDIDIYYELVFALVGATQAAIATLGYCGSSLELVTRNNSGEINGGFEISYDSHNTTFSVDWELDSNRSKFSIGTNNIKEFAYMFRVLILLNQWQTFASDNYITDKLKNEIN
ncbi:hypothetical protein AAXB25_29220 [Paenibacillus lautus]|uniref:hypothetical protein n=1 Tax=Paenibacillus lautus TaxID=1401 RepID=UPI003D2B1388